MTELLAYLYALDHDGDWVSSTFSQLEPLLDATRAALKGEDRIAILHVGFRGLSMAEVAALAAPYSRALIVSDTAAAVLGERLSVTAAAIGCVRGMVFRQAVQGLGCEAFDPAWVDEAVAAVPTAAPEEAGPAESEQPSAEHGEIERSGDAHAAAASPSSFVQSPHVPVKPPRADWLSGLAARAPELATQAVAAGIVDDEAYQALEPNLPRSLRRDLGLARMSGLTGAEPDADNILENLWASPPWFMAVSLSVLKLTVRQANVFRAHALETVEHISAMGPTRLLKLPNLGQGSVYLLRTQLLAALTAHAGLAADPVDGDNGIHGSDASSQALTSLKSGLKAAAALLHDAERHVWAGRLGFGCTPMTLQELAETMNLSRERVRQIESRIYRKVGQHPLWEELARRLEDALRGRSSALKLHELPEIDPWFADEPSLAPALAKPLRELLADRLGVFQVGEDWVVSRLKPNEWDEICDSARGLLESGARDRLEESVLRRQCDQLLTGRGEELRSALWAEVASAAQWAMRPDQPRRLVGLGHGANEVVLAVLESAEHPLHFEEIHRRAVALHGSDHDLRSLQNAAHEVAILFDRGVYGLALHCPLTADELSLVREEVEGLMSAGDPMRQWHAAELCQALQDRGLGFEGRLTKYVVNHALKDRPALVYLRRMVWALGGEWEAGAASRLDVRQSIISLLQDEGRPMTTTELRTRLAAVRGVNHTFQIYPSDPLMRIGPSLWGLRQWGFEADVAAKGDQTTASGAGN